MRDLNKAIHLSPEDADAYFVLARLQARQHQWVTATAHVLKTLELGPSYFEEIRNEPLLNDILRSSKSSKPLKKPKAGWIFSPAPSREKHHLMPGGRPKDAYSNCQKRRLDFLTAFLLIVFKAR